MNRLNTVGCFSLYGEPKRYRDCTLIIYSYLDNVTSPSISNRAQSSNHTDFFILDFAPKIIRVQPFQSIPILNWKKFEILNEAFLLQRIVNLGYIQKSRLFNFGPKSGSPKKQTFQKFLKQGVQKSRLFRVSKKVDFYFKSNKVDFYMKSKKVDQAKVYFFGPPLN